MSRLRWRKIWGDLWANEMRSLLAILAIAIGVFSVGSVLSTYAILIREIDANYMGTTPASAKLFMENADGNLVQAVEQRPDVASAALRRTIRARIRLDSENWLPFKLMVIDDFATMDVSTFASESGSWPPAPGEILLERASISIKQVGLGDQLVMQTPAGEAYPLTISGIVHDPSQAPGWQDGIDYGYITPETLALLGENNSFNELHILVAENQLDEAHINQVAAEVRDFSTEIGYPVSAVTVPMPGVHPHTDQMESLLFLLQAFGVLTLLLSGVLVATIIAALLKQQTQQIGAMKAIGGQVRQIATGYFGMVLILGISALFLGIPLSISAGRGYAAFTATLLNFDITDSTIPLWVFGVQIIVGLTIPLLAAAVPIIQGSRITVREAIADIRSSGTLFQTNFINTLTTNIAGLSRPMIISLSNTFRRRVRLVFIVVILAVGGATFMSAINVNQAWLDTIGTAFSQRNYDFKIDFTQPYPTHLMEEALLSIPGVVAVESWNSAIAVQEEAITFSPSLAAQDGGPNANRQKKGPAAASVKPLRQHRHKIVDVGLQGPSDTDGTGSTDGIRFNLSAVLPDTTLIAYPLIQGRWLQPGDTNALVINHEMLYDDHADIRPGSTVNLRINGQTEAWEVVGVVREVGAPRRGLGIPASAYVSLDYFNQLTGMDGSTVTARVQTAEHGPEAHAAYQKTLDTELAAAGYRVADLQASTTRRQILEDHLVVILAFLMMMAMLIATVGGLALASVISINVMERSREIGMMRAIGGSSRVILQMILVEGVLIGLLSWVAAVLVARPLGTMVGNLAGWLFIRSDLESSFAPSVALIWLGLIITISLGASFYPAWSATRQSVREVLSYE